MRANIFFRSEIGRYQCFSERTGVNPSESKAEAESEAETGLVEVEIFHKNTLIY